MQGPGIDVDVNAVAVLHNGDGAAAGGLRGDVADAGAAGRAGEAAVGHQRHRLRKAHAHQCRGGGQHLPHAGAALGAFVPDHQHFAMLYHAAVDGLDGILLTLKAAGRTAVPAHGGRHGPTA